MMPGGATQAYLCPTDAKWADSLLRCTCHTCLPSVVVYLPSVHLPPPFCVICHPLFVSFATPFFRSFATRTFATPKNLSLILEGVVDKELAKLVEKVNEELVMDVVVEGVVDNR